MHFDLSLVSKFGAQVTLAHRSKLFGELDRLHEPWGPCLRARCAAEDAMVCSAVQSRTLNCLNLYV